MPGMTGFEVLDKLRQEPKPRAVPVVIVTSRVLTDAQRKDLLERAVAIVSKEGMETGRYRGCAAAGPEQPISLGALRTNDRRHAVHSQRRRLPARPVCAHQGLAAGRIRSAGSGDRQGGASNWWPSTTRSSFFWT